MLSILKAAELESVPHCLHSQRRRLLVWTDLPKGVFFGCRMPYFVYHDRADFELHEVLPPRRIRSKEVWNSEQCC